MAHFAELNNSNEVLRVVVISNEDVNANGGDLSVQAEDFVATLVPHHNGGNQWKQTSYNDNFRKQYAGIGFTYDATKDKFINPQPFASWSLDDNDDWQAPVAYPSIIGDGQATPEWRYMISWNETKYNADNTRGWEATKSNDEAETPTVYDWNGTAWVSA